MPRETREQRVVRERFVDQYLPDWCASRPQPLDPSNFVAPDWSFLTPGLARWFLGAIDEGVVEARSDGEFMLGSSYPDGIFELAGRKDESPRPMRIRKESFVEVAAVGMLAVRYRWPVERLRFQPPGWALDFLAYVDDDWDRSEVAIAGEAKQFQKDAVALSASLKVCGERGDHDEADCTEPKNHHRKYLGSSSTHRASSGSSGLERSPAPIPISSFEWRRAAATSSVCVAQAQAS